MANNNFEQITEYFDAYVAKAKGVVSLKSFIEENSDIIDKFSRGEDVDVRRFWNSKFTELVTERGIKNFRKDQPDWDAVRSPFKKALPKSRKRASSSSSISSATASSSSSSPSSLPPQCESSNSNSVKSSTESTTKRRKKITIALTEHVEPVVLHESTDKWVVGEVPVTEKLLEYRDLSIEKGKEGMLDAYQEEMSINGIFLIDGLESVYPSSSLEYGFDEQTWELMVEECNGRYPVEELSDSVIKALSQFEKAAHKNLNSCSAIADKVDSTFIKESLINIVFSRCLQDNRCK
ncbi:hypothetical protein BDB00DRAFT_943248 [Zychaea mexicana]|uniref:uncharacterized protein n=1 Tax=Zychaea mexicana TaxID=64656 RepID=UPI0022FF01E1|nr:uncharacterized protein BDB00DRAFT_943248 [Zychaea mexicana]KAI9482606.1 hypothetical protein BDB00DRAFT_943248 [Zychaea mexicana]